MQERTIEQASLTSDGLLSIYSKMLLIRRFEERVSNEFARGHVPSFPHLAIGQEAVAVGVCSCLSKTDYVQSTHRGHGHALARGSDPKRIMAEIFGKVSGYCSGKGGTMHVVDMSNYLIGGNGIVGSGIAIATGVGLAIKTRKLGSVVVVFFGDGASNSGAFHESLNVASLLKLPIVYVCENNGFAISTRTSESTSVDRISKRAVSYSMPGISVDGNDVTEVYKAANSAIERARSGSGPTLLECLTYRVRGHYEGDAQEYRTKDEVQASLSTNDPISRMADILLAMGNVNKAKLSEISRDVDAVVEEAAMFASSSAFPTVEATLTDVEYEATKNTGDIALGSASPSSLKEMTYIEAIRQAMAEEMQINSSIVVLGEDVRNGGSWGITRGLFSAFGGERVINTPISESSIHGIALGAALGGLTPFVYNSMSEFLYLAADAILDNAAKIRYWSAGQFKQVPVVFNGSIGARGGTGTQHSTVNASMFMNQPGLKVVAPATPYDAKGLLKSSLRDGNPVVFLTHKKLFPLKGAVPEGEYTIPIGSADVLRRGTDVTLCSYSNGVYTAQDSAKTLEQDGIECEVINLRTLRPLDKGVILDSVRKTGRLVVIDEGWSSAGVSAEIIALVSENLGSLKQMPIRINALDAPVPVSPPLEKFLIPSAETVHSSVKKMFSH